MFDKLIELTRQLYPRGRAFKMFTGSNLERLHKALGVADVQAYNDALAIHNSILPDNVNFQETDATQWEKRLGLITNTAVDLELRKLAIRRKLNHPGDIPARHNYRYLQSELRAAGFDVYVYENIFDDGMGGYETKDPLTLTGGVGMLDQQHGDWQHGDVQHGGTFENIVVNHIEDSLDREFNVGVNLRATFFIGGTPIGTFASIPEARRKEFRQLVLKLKRVKAVGYLFINYI
jgi:hypothetical protein